MLINVAEELLILLELALFLIAAYFFIASFFYEKKVRQHIISNRTSSSFIFTLFVPSILIPDRRLDEDGIKYKRRALISLVYTLSALLLALGLLFTGIETLKLLDSLANK